MDSNYVTLVSVEENGVRYELVARRIDPDALDKLGPETGPFGGAIMQDLKVVARKA